MTCLIKCIHLSFLSFLYVKKVGENVQIYAERLLTSGKDNFSPDIDRQTVERQLIGFFVDRLLRQSKNEINERQCE